NAKTYLKEHPELADRLEKAIRGKTEEVAEGMMTGPDAEDDGE
ncbi:MAG: DNA recombination/repair protein RecA, partial [Pseudomonadota bacterium]